ncbi:UDP-N-acetylmuramate--L-alanine ligase [Patescibacteria group bacterium]|nr:UDP-N-acetylmuramate--L-alanine ligase [Patescibacteria group bacterium]
MNLNKINKIHFIGIGGIGVSAIAKMMLKLGKKVSGSDVCRSEIINKLVSAGAKVNFVHQASNLSDDVDLAVYSVAVPNDNPERLQAEELNIPQMSYGEFLGQLSEDKKTIAVTGTNGKTTTSAILGKALVDCGLDPTVIIGSQLKDFDGNLHLGQSEYLAIEADEYKANMLKVKPWSILLTSIEEDHLDFYKDLADIVDHFQRFVDKLPASGFLFYNADDANIKNLKLPQNSFSCSLNQQADYWAKDIKLESENYKFKAYHQDKFLDEFSLKIPGNYNILNSLMAIGLCHQMKIDLNQVKKSLAGFSNLWRRFEVLGNLNEADNVLTVSDYTHHPSAIKKTLKAAKEFYPGRRLFLVYQPHQHDRTKKLFAEFINCFNQADYVILHEIYDVAGRKYEADEKISSKNLVDKINKNNVVYSSDFATTKKLIYKNIRASDLLLIMGAGDIDNLARELV